MNNDELEWFRAYGEFIGKNYPRVNNQACEYADSINPSEVIPNAEWTRKSFEQFWLAYPKKVGKKQTATQWKRINADQKLYNKIIQALEKQKQERERKKMANIWTPEFQDPVRWLKNERWEDIFEEEHKVFYKKPNIKERDER